MPQMTCGQAAGLPLGLREVRVPEVHDENEAVLGDRGPVGLRRRRSRPCSQLPFQGFPCED